MTKANKLYTMSFMTGEEVYKASDKLKETLDRQQAAHEESKKQKFFNLLALLRRK